ncbi:MAG: hypothetical protein QXO70_00470, partial [Candidatus Pacearchaeota archaeon]
TDLCFDCIDDSYNDNFKPDNYQMLNYIFLAFKGYIGSVKNNVVKTFKIMNGELVGMEFMGKKIEEQDILFFWRSSNYY